MATPIPTEQTYPPQPHFGQLVGLACVGAIDMNRLRVWGTYEGGDRQLWVPHIGGYNYRFYQSTSNELRLCPFTVEGGNRPGVLGRDLGYLIPTQLLAAIEAVVRSGTLVVPVATREGQSSNNGYGPGICLGSMVPENELQKRMFAMKFNEEWFNDPQDVLRWTMWCKFQGFVNAEIAIEMRCGVLNPATISSMVEAYKEVLEAFPYRPNGTIPQFESAQVWAKVMADNPQGIVWELGSGRRLGKTELLGSLEPRIMADTFEGAMWYPDEDWNPNDPDEESYGGYWGDPHEQQRRELGLRFNTFVFQSEVAHSTLPVESWVPSTHSWGFEGYSNIREGLNNSGYIDIGGFCFVELEDTRW